MRGYFAIGVERVSKQMNLGNLMRSAHAFGANFVFTVGAHYKAVEAKSDTSKFESHLPLYHWETIDQIQLPKACKLVGMELLEEATDLPSFHHPLQAAYILGPEKGSLSEETVQKCDFLVKIPTSFCINVAMAGAIVMYDRVKSLGRFAPRPLSGIAPEESLPAHSHGTRFSRKSDS